MNSIVVVDCPGLELWRAIPAGRRKRAALVHAMLCRLGVPIEKLPIGDLYVMDCWRLIRLSCKLGRKVERVKGRRVA